jgi:predicted nucleotidyltransferase
MPSAEQQDLIDALRGFLEADADIEAVWLAGSLGRGGGDEHSDVDLLVLVGDGAASEVSARVAGKLNIVVEPVLVNALYGGRILNVVTADWQRFDLSLVEAADLARYNAAELTPLFNRGDRAPPLQPDAPYQTAPDAVLKLVQEFLRVLGLLVGAMGRQEYELSLAGLALMRGMTMDLMLAENDVSPAKRGGALRRNPLLTSEQREALASLPPQSASRESAIESNRALAAIFLPRAKRLAARVEMAWPQALEDATRRNLKRRLDLDI